MIVRPEFASGNPAHRKLIREALHEFLIQEGAPSDDVENVLDLENRPRVEGWAISISHCRGLGGFVAERSDSAIGFDLESVARVSRPACERVCGFPDERNLLDALKTPDELAFYWVAKEAAAKACGNDAPNAHLLIRDAHIVSLDAVENTFRAVVAYDPSRTREIGGTLSLHAAATAGAVASATARFSV